MSEGRAELSGEIPLAIQRQTAEETARRVFGVREVDTRVAVVAAALTDPPWLLETARQALADLGVDARVELHVVGDEATLLGTVGSRYERDLVTLEEISGIGLVRDETTLANRG
ncbi:MAG: BON domain-containing protein [Polyangiaceae bacterium]